MQWRRLGWWIGVVVVLFGADLLFGSTPISPAEIWQTLSAPSAATQDATLSLILWEIRLPKALTAALVGAALSVAGLLMQALFRNPLAGPDVLGISAGASLGVAVVVLAAGPSSATWLGQLGLLGELAVVGAAMVGAVIMLLVMVAAASRFNNLVVLILGLMLGYATGAMVTVLLHFSAAERIQAFVSWTFGSFGGVTWQELRVLAPVLLVSLFASLVAGKNLNALALGEIVAATLGVAVRRLRLVLILVVAVLAGSATAFCGPIAFLGVAAPHLARHLARGGDHRRLLPLAAVVGSACALLADLLAQLPASLWVDRAVLPLNAVMALLGVPWIVALLLRRISLPRWPE